MANYNDEGEMFADMALENQQEEMEHVIKTSLQLTTENLSLFETTKLQRSYFVNYLIQELDEGKFDPLKIHLQVKAMEDIITRLTSTDEKKNKDFTAAIRYRQLLLDAAEKYGQKSFEFNNAKFEIKETGSTYDYDKCDDPVIDLLLSQKEDIDKQVKARQEFLKTISAKGLDIVHEDEVRTIYPPSKKSTTSVAVSFK